MSKTPFNFGWEVNNLTVTPIKVNNLGTKGRVETFYKYNKSTSAKEQFVIAKNNGDIWVYVITIKRLNEWRKIFPVLTKTQNVTIAAMSVASDFVTMLIEVNGLGIVHCNDSEIHLIKGTVRIDEEDSILVLDSKMFNIPTN